MATQGHILIVDDEVPTLKLLGMALEKEGFRISAAQTSEQAMARVEAERPDLVVLDVMLPGASGLDLCRQLRGSQDTANLPIILLSAKGEVADRISGLEAGADEYLIKPIDTREFLARVVNLLERTRRRLEAAGAHAARVVAFIGAQGGVGTSSMVVNIGVALATEQVETVAVELRASAGTFPVLLGVKPPRGLAELLRADVARITPQEIGARLVHHGSGLQVLCAPDQMSPELLGEDQAAAILTGLAARAELLLVDLPPLPTPAVRAAIPRSQVLVLVVEPVRTSIERAAAMAPMLESLATSGADLKILVNSRAPLASPAGPSEISDRLGWPLIGAIPPAPDEFLRAANLGRPIIQVQPDGVLAQAIRQVATALRA